MSIDMTAIHAAFFEEAADLLIDFEGHLLHLEETPEDKEILNSIFRCAHSIKGGSATFGFPEVARFTHSLETLLDGVRNGLIPVTTPLCRLLLEAFDQMKVLLDVAKGEATDAPNSDALIARLVEASMVFGEDGELVEDDGWGLLGVPQIFELSFSPGSGGVRSGNDPLKVLTSLRSLAEFLTLDCDCSALPNLAALDPERCYMAWNAMLQTNEGKERLIECLEGFGEQGNYSLSQLGGESLNVTEEPVERPSSRVAVPAAVATQGLTSKDGGTIKISADKLDTLINLVGELVISQSMLSSATQDFEMSKLPQLIEAVAFMERSSRELQERVMGIRMLPIKMAFGRFPRLVHDLSSAVGKKIELKLTGEETELDKNLIEAIGDPLTHLVRNSIDHGLETPEDRIDAGKSDVGVLSIGAFHEGGSIVIEVADDGKGLNRERILAKAIDRGLVSCDESLSDEQIYNLIFHPGFSTAESVTDLSGRGVGMDIVKQAIAGIGGSLRVESTPGRGVSTRIRLPLTMAILEGQSMTVGDGVYIVPLTSIVESVRPRQEDLHQVAHIGEVVTVRNEFLPVLRLYELFGLEPRITNPWEGSLVLVECEGQKVALMVDELMGQGQVVIKSMETNYRKVDGIAGATILGDGRVALIVDVPGLIRGNGGRSGTNLSAA